MPVTFNDGKGNEQPQKPDIIKKIIEVVQKLEEEINTNKRTITSKVNGNTFSLTEKIRELTNVIDSIDTRVSIIGERTPEELTIGPVQEMISNGYVSIQIKASSELVQKSAEFDLRSFELETKLKDEVKVRESVALSLATDIVANEERSVNRYNTLITKIDDIKLNPTSTYNVIELTQKIENLTNLVERLRVDTDNLSSKIDREIFSEMNQRIRDVNSINSRFI